MTDFASHGGLLWASQAECGTGHNCYNKIKSLLSYVTCLALASTLEYGKNLLLK